MRKPIFARDPFWRRALRSVVFASAFFALAFTTPVMAQVSNIQQNFQQTAQAAGVQSQADLPTIIGRIINIFLGFLGIIFLILMLYAGYQWMTAGGDAEKVQKAQGTIRNAIIGLILIVSAFAITNFIIGFFAGQGGGGGILPPLTSGQVSISLPSSSGSLGAGIIESHYPERDATGVPRNTKIIITFKQPIYPGSFISGWTEAASNTVTGLNSDVVKVYRTGQGGGPSTALSSSQASVSYTADHRTYVIRPVDYLGSPTVNVDYQVDLSGGTNGVQLDETSGNTHPAAFSGSFSSGYSWDFQVSTQVDLTPPTITAVVPESGTDNFRNIVIQFYFSKPMDPTSVTGKVPGFSNLEVLSGSGGAPPTTPVPGEFRISNHYQTVEFVTTALCGTNSCGREVYCLPANAAIQVTAHAADVDSTSPPQAIFTSNGYNGAVSVAGNSLDGNANGQAEGRPADDFVWGFGTNDTIKLTPPQVVATTPDADPSAGTDSNVPLDQAVEAQFDTLLQPSTVNSDNVKLSAHGKDETNPDTFWFAAGLRLVNADGTAYDPNATPPTVPAGATISITHRPFLPSGNGVSNLNLYDPYLLSGIQDSYQNCFNPAGACGGGTGKGTPNCCRNSPTSADCQTILQTP